MSHTKKLYRAVLILAILISFFSYGLVHPQNASAAANLTVEIIAAPNLVVDSNALSASTYAPKVATVIGKFCNEGNTAANDVTAYIGNYDDTDPNTPGIYPSRSNITIGDTTYVGTYAFEHLGGTADASRYLGDLDAGECQYQYWSFEYPHYANDGTIATWGTSVKPNDDLALAFDMWVANSSGTLSANDVHTATMRNEISAMANKIKPNGNPAGVWFNTDTSTVYPGQTVTTNGVFYRLGNVNQGFDNDGDGVPDYNAWLQPFGDPAYDPSCFRLVGVTGVLTVTRSAGNPDLIIPIDNNLYFTDIPADNTDVRGLVYYEFLALGGACTVPITPYQEVASGSDNEKFNGDYGTGVPPLLSYEPAVTLDKTAPGTVAEGATITYQIDFDNTSEEAVAGLTLSSGDVNAGLMISDTVPIGLEYVANSAGDSVSGAENSIPTGNSVTIRHSTDGGQTFIEGDLTSDTPSSAGSEVIIQWWLDEPLEKSPINNSGYVRYQAAVPSDYITDNASPGDPFIENCATAGFGDGAPFAEACDTTLVKGNNIVGDLVWKDESGEGVYDLDGPDNIFGNADDEPGLADISVSLYWDKNSDGQLDNDDVLVTTTTTIDYTVINGYIDISGNGAIGAEDDLTALQGIEVIDGALDINDDGIIDSNDSGSFVGYTVINGLLDMDGSTTITTDGNDDGDLLGRYQFSFLPDGNYLVAVNSSDTDIPTGYSSTTVEVHDVALDPSSSSSTGVVNYDADFGFGPTLRVSKQLATLDPAYVNETVAFEIDLVNTRPGDGTANGYCVYDVWPSTTSTDSNTNKQFASIQNAIGAPDQLYSSSSFETGGGQWIAGSSYSSGGRSSGITSVKAVIDFYIASNLVDDGLQVSILNGATAWSYEFTAAELNAVSPGEGKKGQISVSIPGTAAPDGSWDWGDFDSAIQLQLDMVKNAAAESTIAVMYLDAFGFEVTTNDTSCSTGDSTINPLPLTDTYNATYLEFLYAEPPVSSQTSGTITWDNLGPLYAGGTETVIVYFKALAPVASTTNTASVTEAKFSSGRDTNDDNDNATVGINASFSLSGKTWIDSGGTIGWSGTTGYDSIPSIDNALPNIKMDLYLCVDNDGLPIEQSTNRNSACGANAGESWQWVGTEYTDLNGDYTFVGLKPGYYNVQANETNLPTGMTQRTGEASAGANGTGIGGNPCTTCDGAWNEQATVIKDLTYLSANITEVNFGYNNPTLGTVTGYVWHDQDQGGYNDWDASEPPIPGATVTLYCIDGGGGCGSPSYTTTTNEYGYYQFSGLNTTNVSYYAVITPPSGMGQTADPNYSTGSCYGDAVNCDSQTNTFTLAAGGVHGPDLFGYYGGLTIGDTVYTDWDGNGTQNTTTEEGIGGVRVYLYRDSDGDGARDSGAPLIITDTLYNIIDGYLDVDNDGVINDTDDDDALLRDVQVIDGKLDISGNGTIGAEDDGTFAGYAVIDGLIDVNGGGVTTDDDASMLGKYEFNNLAGNNDYVVVVDTGTLPAGYTQTGDPDETNTCATCDSQDPLSLGSVDYLDADFGYQPQGFSSIGDTVWLDENGNGVQDSAEDGVPGVTVNLYEDGNGDGVIDSNDALVKSTTTLGYGIIDGYIDVDGDGTINDTGDDDASAQGVEIIDGKLDVNGDGTIDNSDDGEYFGYRVIDGLLDVDGDANVTGDTDDDDNLFGKYQFIDLPAGNYIVEIPDSNFDQTTDPLYSQGQTYDQDSATVLDNQDAVTLGDAETYTDGDFGYTSSAIGDFIWRDNDGDGIWDSNEPGIQGVTVELYCDPDNTGDVNDASVTSCGTATTDADGYYLFGGLDANNYIIEVTDTGGVLTNYTLTGDPNSYNTEDPTILTCKDPDTQACDDINILAEYTDPHGTIFPGLQLGQNNLTSDFGYQPNGAMVGDTVWIDGNGNGVRDANEAGIPYITVDLCTNSSCSGTVITTATDENGYYTFSGLADDTYYIRVNTGDPDFPSGLAPTYDHDGTADSIINSIQISGGHVTGDAGGTCTTNCDLDMDFGYYYSGSYSISGTIFFDATGDGGIFGASSTDAAFSEITVFLWKEEGGSYKLIAATTTSAVATTTPDGAANYTFDNLPDGNYRVSFDTSNAKLKGMSITSDPDDSDCSDGGCNNRVILNTLSSLVDTNGDLLNQDFGLYASIDFGDLPDTYNLTLVEDEGAGHIIGTIYLGAIPDSETDGQESPTANIDSDDGVDRGSAIWVPGETATLNVTVSGDNGFLVAYMDWNGDNVFSSDEQVIASDVSNGTTAFTVDIPESTASVINARFRLYDKAELTYYAPTGLTTNGEVEDYQWPMDPTAVQLVAFTAAWNPDTDYVDVTWSTAIEIKTVGFHVLRATSRGGPYTRITTIIIPVQFPGGLMGGNYAFVDENVEPGITYYYKLEELEAGGNTILYGPVSTGASPTAVGLTTLSGHGYSIVLLGLIAVALILTPALQRRTNRQRD